MDKRVMLNSPVIVSAKDIKDHIAKENPSCYALYNIQVHMGCIHAVIHHSGIYTELFVSTRMSFQSIQVTYFKEIHHELFLENMNRFRSDTSTLHSIQYGTRSVIKDYMTKRCHLLSHNPVILYVYLLCEYISAGYDVEILDNFTVNISALYRNSFDNLILQNIRHLNSIMRRTLKK